MILNVLGTIYGAAVRRRRRWYARHPDAQRRLARPVISIGNVRVGGSGKTPVVAHVARMLSEAGEHPVILSRGYKRRDAAPGVTVVSDGRTTLVPAASAGDEPMMLARALPGVPVLVCPDRFLAGERAEQQYGATVHILDDGFQHLALARDIDLVLIDESDLVETPLPGGRLREPLEGAAAADALLVTCADATVASSISRRLGGKQWFLVERRIGELLSTSSTPMRLAPSEPLFAVAGIARPDRFFADLIGQGRALVGTKAFRDHHWFDQRDIDDILKVARESGAKAVVTTGKDAVRLEGLDWHGMPMAIAPLDVTVAPAEAFRSWLLSRLAASRVSA